MRILHSLSCSKYKILAKDPPGKAPGKNDTFSINMAFTDRMRRIKVPLPRPPIYQHSRNDNDIFTADAPCWARTRYNQASCEGSLRMGHLHTYAYETQCGHAANFYTRVVSFECSLENQGLANGGARNACETYHK